MTPLTPVARPLSKDRRELDLRGASAGEAIDSRHAHCVIDLGVTENVFFGKILVVLEIGVVTVLRVEGFAICVLGDQVVKLFLSGS